MGKVKIFCGEGCTKQAMKAECDINNIIKRFKKSGTLPKNMLQGTYADVSEIGDYHESLNKVIQAETTFMKLPVEIRKRFAHDPGEFIKYAQDPKNVNEMISLGLAKAKTVKAETPDVTPTQPEGVK
jgi:phage internal scaffolding protein